MWASFGIVTFTLTSKNWSASYIWCCHVNIGISTAFCSWDTDRHETHGQDATHNVATWQKWQHEVKHSHDQWLECECSTVLEDRAQVFELVERHRDMLTSHADETLLGCPSTVRGILTFNILHSSKSLFDSFNVQCCFQYTCSVTEITTALSLCVLKLTVKPGSILILFCYVDTKRNL